MNYSEFKQFVSQNQWSISVLRCNAPPPAELFAVMDELGLDTYERFVLRYEQEGADWN